MQEPTKRRIYGFVFGVLICQFWFVPQTNAQEVSPTLNIPALIQAVNDDRRDAGLPALRRDPVLDAAAQAKASDMIANGYFSHNSPTGVEPWHWFKQAGYEYLFAGENLALDYNDPEAVQAAWMASPKHRENILNSDYEDVGYAVATGTLTNINGTYQVRQGIVIVQLFGKRLPGVLAQQNGLITDDNDLAVVEPIASPAIEGRTPQITADNLWQRALNSLTQQVVIGNFNVATTDYQPSQLSIVADQSDSRSRQSQASWPIISMAIAGLMVTAGFHTRVMV